MKPRLVIHIGLRKTGSSALQEKCRKESDFLLSQNIVYPKSLTKWPAHQELAWCLRSPSEHSTETGGEDFLKKEYVFNHYKDYIKQQFSKGNHVLLSSEDLSLLSFDISAIKYLQDQFHEFAPEIAVYCRDFIDFHISNYKHDVLRGGSTKSFAEYLFCSSTLFTYHQPLIVQVWESAFTKIHKLKYENIPNMKNYQHFLNRIFDLGIVQDIPYASNVGADSNIISQALFINKSTTDSAEAKKKIRQLQESKTSGRVEDSNTKESNSDFLLKNLNDDQIRTLHQIYSDQ